LLVLTQKIHGEPVFCPKEFEYVGGAHQAEKHQRRIKGYRGKRIHGDAGVTSAAGPGRHNRNPSAKASESIAQFPMIGAVCGLFL
jgi:hypothetical protein